MRLPGRRAHRVDANQPEIVDALRKIGAVVVVVGHPFDLLVGWRSQWITVEVKDGSKPPSARELTDDERKFAELCVDKSLRHYVVKDWDDVTLALRLSGIT